MTDKTLHTTFDLSTKALLASMFLGTPALGNTAHKITEPSPPKRYFVAQDTTIPESNNIHQTESRWDAPSATIKNKTHKVLSLTLMDTPATSEDIQAQIMAGIDRQLRIAEEEERDVVMSKPSKSSLFRFVEMYEITSAPFVVLEDNGNLSASWDYVTGEEFSITFLRDGSVNYVAFLNKTELNQTKEEILHGRNTIEGVMEFIDSNGIVL